MNRDMEALNNLFYGDINHVTNDTGTSSIDTMIDNNGDGVYEGDSESLTTIGGAHGQQMGRFSTDDRRLLIRKLIEKRRLSKQQLPNVAATGESLNRHSNNIEEEEEDIPHSLAMELVTEKPESNDMILQSNDAIYQLPQRQRANSFTSQRSNKRYYDNNSLQNSLQNSHNNHRYSYDDSHLQLSRRRDKIELQIRQEMFREFTFRPKIKEIPVHIYDTIPQDKSSFYDRVSKWKRELDYKNQQRKIKYEKAELQDCSFKPKSSVPPSRYGNDIIIHQETSYTSTNERLYSQYDQFVLDRQTEREQALQLRYALEAQECTFTPNIKTANSKYIEVKAKFADDIEKPDYEDIKIKLETRGCTFTPKIKGIKDTMSSAKLYASQPVINRLSSSNNNKRFSQTNLSTTQNSFDYFNLGGEKPPVDISSFMGSVNSTNNMKMNKSIKGMLNDKAQRSETGSQAGTKLGREDTVAFKEFLGRQAQTQLKTQREIDEIRQACTPIFKPNLCTKSLEIAERNSRGEFLERVERDNLRRSEFEANQIIISSNIDDEATFKPKLFTNNKMEARSVYELSQGDYIKAEQRMRTLKYRTERELIAELTFEPNLSKFSREQGQSVFAKAKELNTSITDVYRGTLMKIDRKREEIKLAKEEEVKALCTFTPKTTKCPAYISRIARSLSASRANKKAEIEKTMVEEKPLWK